MNTRNSDHMAKNAQVILLFAYLALAVLFGREKRTWPVCLYYIGCFVKDAGVFALAFYTRLFQ